MSILVAVAALPLVVLLGISGLRAPLRVLLPIYALLVPFGSGLTLAVGIPSPFDSLTSLFGLAVIIGLGIQLLVHRATGPIRTEVLAWIAFAGLNGVTYLWSVNRGRTASQFFILASLLALYVLVSMLPIDPGDVARLRDGIIVGGTLACAYGFYLLLTGALPEEAAGLPRFATAGGAGDASDPNITAAVLVLPIVLGLARTLRARSGGVRLAAGLATALMVVGLLLTASRGGALAATVGIIVLLAHERRSALVGVGVVATVAVVVLASTLLAPEQVERLQTSGSSGRTNIYDVAFVACSEHCLTGSGLNTFREVHRDAYLRTPGAVGVRIDEPPHNILLGAVIELGVAGLLILVGAVVLTIRSLRHLPRDVRGAPLAAIIGLLVSNAFLGNLYFKYFWLVLLYAVVVSAGHREQLDDDPRADPGVPTRNLVAATP